MMENNYFDTAFKYLEDSKYKDNQMLRKKLENFKCEVSEDFMNGIGNNFKVVSPDNEELMNAIGECAVDLISLIKLFKYVLKNEGKKDLGNYSNEGEQFNFIHDHFMSEFIKMLPKGTNIKMEFRNDEDDDEEED